MRELFAAISEDLNPDTNKFYPLDVQLTNHNNFNIS